MSSSSRVMKSSQFKDALTSGQYNYEDLQHRCENYLDSVREQSRQMLTDAQQEIEQLKQQAIEEGRRLGIEQGLQEAETTIQQRIQDRAAELAEQRLQKLLPGLRQATDQIHGIRDQVQAEWQQQGLQLAVSIAEKLTHRLVEEYPEIVIERMEQVLKMVVGESRIQIHLAQKDLDLLQDQLELVQQRMQQMQISLVGHAELDSGEMLVQMEYGEIDARIETQLQRITSELLGLE